MRSIYGNFSNTTSYYLVDFMADHKDVSASNVDNDPSYAHNEHKTDEIRELATLDITYDSNGIKGFLHSPFVCGAALLASFGGFSFGYGRS